MSEEQVNRLETVIRTWLNAGAQCSSSLKPYTRSLYPTYKPGIRVKRTHRRETRSRRRSHAKKSSKRVLSTKSSRNSMIQVCEDFLRNHRRLLDI
ncbi:unnamed protein product [Adineta ricciae]|uniref:Uncharacterized protein n=1 Tax=Adineta ricciae TaxID=249248 RepID=A0A815LPD8_ADIRI|nr:unnamed protein product [Adineta ricciae]